MVSSLAALTSLAILASLGLLAILAVVHGRGWIPPRTSHDPASVRERRRLALALVLSGFAGACGGALDSPWGVGLVAALVALVWVFATPECRPPHEPGVPPDDHGRGRLSGSSFALAGLLSIWGLWIAHDAALVRLETIPAPQTLQATPAASALDLSWDAPSATLPLRNDSDTARAVRDVRIDGEDWTSFVPTIEGPALIPPGATGAIRVNADTERFLVGHGATSRDGYRAYRSGSAVLSARIGPEVRRVPITFHGHDAPLPWHASGAIALLLVCAAFAMSRADRPPAIVGDVRAPLGPHTLLTLSVGFVCGALVLTPIAPRWCLSWPFLSPLVMTEATCGDGLGAVRLAVWPLDVSPLIAWVLCTWSIAFASLASAAGVRGAMVRTRVCAILLLGFSCSLLGSTPAGSGLWSLLAAALLAAGAACMWRLHSPTFVDQLHRLAATVLIANQLAGVVPSGWWVRLLHWNLHPPRLLIAMIAIHVSAWILLDAFFSRIPKRLVFLSRTGWH